MPVDCTNNAATAKGHLFFGMSSQAWTRYIHSRASSHGVQIRH